MIKKHLNRGLKVFTALIVLTIVTFGLFSFIPEGVGVAYGLETGLAIPGSGEISKSISTAPIGTTVIRMVNYFTGFLGILAVLSFVYAGTLWVLSGGSEDMITKAKKIMTYAALGMVVVILSFSIVRFIAGSAPGAVDECGGCTDPLPVCTLGVMPNTDPAEVGWYCTDPLVHGKPCGDNVPCPDGFGCIPPTGGGKCYPEDMPFVTGPKCYTEVQYCPPGAICDCPDKFRCTLYDNSKPEEGGACKPDAMPFTIGPKCTGDIPGECPDGFVCETELLFACIPHTKPFTVGRECYFAEDLAADESPPENAIPSEECAAGFDCNVQWDPPRCTAADEPFTVGGPCEVDNDCSAGFYCEYFMDFEPADEKPDPVCIGYDVPFDIGPRCVEQDDCPSGYTCDHDLGRCLGYQEPFVVGPNCSEDDPDCPAGFTCNLDVNNCLPSDSPFTFGPYCGEGFPPCPSGFSCSEELQRCYSSADPWFTGGDTTSAADQNLNTIDNYMDGLENDLDISDLSAEDQALVEAALDASDTIDGKIANLQSLIDDPNTDPAMKLVLQSLIDGLERLGLIREELDDLRTNMPESKETIESYEETSDALDILIDDAINRTKYRRFDSKYRALKELIRQFPVVQARIRATPGEGNVPFTVQLDGMDSVDPTGGTISTYRWSYLDNSGNEILIGSDAVVVHEFITSNTYAVSLRVSTSQRDESGYKTAMDGVSVVRVRANPPSSRVAFRINGVEIFDVFHVTLSEAQAGLAIDPSLTTPAIGRQIEKYEWSYGDASTETRNSPTTVVHSYNKPGEYFIKLVTTDNIGIKDKKIVKLFVKSLAADVEVSPSTGNVNTEFNFTGVDSRSDDGIIKEYEWIIEDSDGRTVVENEESSFTHRFKRPGIYKINLLVTDIVGSKDRLVEELEVVSRPPIANFTYTIPKSNHPNQVEFNGVDSYDPDEGDSITYSWDFDGDGGYEVADSQEALVTHEYRKVGEYRARLQIEDQFGKRTQVEKKVSVDSILSGDITVDRQVTRVGEPIEFTVQSVTGVAFLWEFGDGETESTEEDTVSHTYKKTGKFTVTLHFFDRDDNDNLVAQRVLVSAGEEPVAIVNYMINGREPRVIGNLCIDGKKTYDGVVVTRADLLRFDGKNSINTDGSNRLLSYDWKLPSGSKSSNKDVSFKFDEVSREGECFSASLVVRDQITGKISGADEIHFKVINELPQLTDFVITPPLGDELVTPVKIQLKVVNPKDADGTIKKYKWWYYREGFEDQKLGVHSTSTHETDMTITSLGEADIMNKYFFVVEITDNDNGVYSSEERFGEVSYMDVKNGPNLSPVAEFTMDKTTISVGDSITFISQSYDPQGDDFPNDSFRWDFDGDGEFDDISSGPQVNRQFNTPGEYEVRLKVVHRGLSSSATKTVFVESTESLPQAAFTYSVEGNTVTFDATHTRFDSTLEDVTLRFEWDFDIQADANGNGIKDDDVESTEAKPTNMYPEIDLYKVKLVVKDMLGMEGVVVRDVDLSITEEERQKNAYHSLKLSAPTHALTTLDLEVVPATLQKGGSADVNIRVLNADGSPYNGEVFFEIMDGSGDFTPNPVTAEDSKASAIYTSTEKGKVRIRIRATDTMHGEMTEEATLNVK